ncbi:hypothetical protein [Indioceanicola profundi]|uniref:hypothetical protein n=1 Tax=Indioceanicola profundi TaxID=2220096 RepID=UPI000E6AB6B1|nr:hypothetical protein [Indioceanicola profundi]
MHALSPKVGAAPWTGRGVEDRLDQDGRVNITDLLEPVLQSQEADLTGLAQSVTLVAEAMAVLGITVTGPAGRPLPGVTDAKAVLHLLRLYRQCLARDGRLEEAMVLRDLARRIERLDMTGPAGKS